MCGTTGNYQVLLVSPSWLAFEDVSGWYGSKMGAVDLWVLPKPTVGAVYSELRMKAMTREKAA
jgi:hypothetical protein